MESAPIPEYDDEEGAEGGEDEWEEEEEEGDEGPTKELRPENYTFSFGTCKICMGPYVLPTTLACGHTFCQACITEHCERTSRENYGAMVCRTCGSSIKQYVDRLRPNFLLLALLTVVNRVLPPEGSDTLVEVLRRALPPQTAADETHPDMDDILTALGDHCVDETHIARLHAYIVHLQDILRRCLANRSRLDSALAMHSLYRATVVDPRDRGVLIGEQIRREARAFFKVGAPGGLPRDLYNLVLVHTNPAVFNKAPRFAELLAMPIFGILAAASVVVVHCGSTELDRVMRDVFGAWGVTHAAIVAQWVEAAVPKLKAPNRRLAGSVHYFVAGTVGQVYLLKERNCKKKVTTVWAPSLANNIPTDVFTAISKTLSKYTSRCIINLKTVQPGWDIFQDVGAV